MKHTTKKFSPGPAIMLSATLVLFLFFFLQLVNAQSSVSVLESRLCKTWRLTQTVQGDKTVKADLALKDFVMIINSDHTIQQGISPDGLISGTWITDEKNMLLIIKDDVTSQEYKMKIVSIASDELVLNDPSASPVIYIHYSTK